jgi:MFS family permease
MVLLRTAAGALRGRLTFPSLDSRQFRLLFASGFLSTTSHWAMFLARGWLAHELTGSALAVGAVTMAAWLPAVFIGPFAGVAADRLDRRRMVIGSMALAAASAFVLAAIELGGYMTIWYLALLAVVSGTAQSIGQPARSSLVANSVRREDLLNAVSLTSLSGFGSRIVGPLLGLPLLLTVGAGGIFLAATFVSIGGLLFLLPVQPQRVAGATATGWRSAIDDLRDAVAYIEADRRLAAVIVLVTLHCGLTMAFDSMMPTLATMVGGAGALYSSIIVGIGVGSVLGILGVSTIRSTDRQGTAFVVAGVGSGLSMVLLGLATTPVGVVLAAGVTGATQATYMALTATIIQQTVSDEMRGRVLAVYLSLATVHMAFLNFGFGWAADGIGVRVLLIVPGLIWTALFALAFARFDTIRSLGRGQVTAEAAA